MSGDYKFDTLSLHAGYVPDPVHGSRAVPIHQTTSYVFQDSEHAAALYNMELGGHLYTRISNPTVAVLEQRVAALDGGVAATATASGMAATATALMTICSSGDHIVASSRMYGANINLLENTFLSLAMGLYPSEYSILAVCASAATVLKWIFVTTAMGLAFLFPLLLVVNKLTDRRKRNTGAVE